MTTGKCPACRTLCAQSGIFLSNQPWCRSTTNWTDTISNMLQVKAERKSKTTIIFRPQRKNHQSIRIKYMFNLIHCYYAHRGNPIHTWIYPSYARCDCISNILSLEYPPVTFNCYNFALNWVCNYVAVISPLFLHTECEISWDFSCVFSIRYRMILLARKI